MPKSQASIICAKILLLLRFVGLAAQEVPVRLDARRTNLTLVLGFLKRHMCIHTYTDFRSTMCSVPRWHIGQPRVAYRAIGRWLDLPNSEKKF